MGNLPTGELMTSRGHNGFKNPQQRDNVVDVEGDSLFSVVSFLFKNIIYLFIIHFLCMGVLSACMYVCALCACLVPGNWSCRWLWDEPWDLSLGSLEAQPGLLPLTYLSSPSAVFLEQVMTTCPVVACLGMSSSLTSIINQGNILQQTCLQASLWRHFLDWESFFSDNSNLCQVGIKLTNTLVYCKACSPESTAKR